MASSKLGWGLLLGGAALFLASGRSRTSSAGSGGNGQGSGGPDGGDTTTGGGMQLQYALQLLCANPKALTGGLQIRLRDSLVQPIYRTERAKYGNLSASQLTTLVETVASKAATQGCPGNASDPAVLEVLQGIAQGLWHSEPGSWSGV